MTLDEIISRLQKVRSHGSYFMALCPAHKDKEPSLRIKQENGRIQLKCFAGCDKKKVLSALGISSNDLFQDGAGDNIPSVSDDTVKPLVGLTLEFIANQKRLQQGYIQGFGVTETKHQGIPRICIPYHDPDGNIVAVRYRSHMPGGFSWRKGDHPILYGLERLPFIRKCGEVLFVEGETDVWTAWYNGIPTLGIPGKTTWREEWALYINGLVVYIWEEPDAEDLTLRVFKDIPELRVILAPEGIKDISEAHIQGLDVAELCNELKAKAFQPKETANVELHKKKGELREKAATILEADDPLPIVEEEIRWIGYGGDIRPAMITYLAATTRLLRVRRGSMLAHLLLIGPPSIGKSYTIMLVILLLPEDAFHTIDAGSPRVLIYDEASLQHKVLLFGEADSLPAGEDNPAASAVRNLAQDGYLHYDVVVKDAATNEYRVKTVRKEGPTVLLTTSVKSVGNQLGSRFFNLEVPFDREYIKAALNKQAEIEVNGIMEPKSALIDFQAYLQTMAPWDVHIPFVRQLAEGINKSVEAPRILRDFSRLLSLIKAVAILRHIYRKCDAKGKLIATLDDYEYVFNLVKEMYEASITGISEKVRDVVKAVRELEAENVMPIRKKNVQDKLGYSKVQAQRYIDKALRNGWIVNREWKKGYAADLTTGEPLPERYGLPSVTQLKPEEKPQLEILESNVNEDGSVTSGYTVTPLTDDIHPPLHISDKPQPTEPCGVCGASNWWQRSGEWICQRCHPRP